MKTKQDEVLRETQHEILVRGVLAPETNRGMSTRVSSNTRISVQKILYKVLSLTNPVNFFLEKFYKKYFYVTNNKKLVLLRNFIWLNGLFVVSLLYEIHTRFNCLYCLYLCY